MGWGGRGVEKEKNRARELTWPVCFVLILAVVVIVSLEKRSRKSYDLDCPLMCAISRIACQVRSFGSTAGTYRYMVSKR